MLLLQIPRCDSPFAGGCARDPPPGSRSRQLVADRLHPVTDHGSWIIVLQICPSALVGCLFSSKQPFRSLIRSSGVASGLQTPSLFVTLASTRKVPLPLPSPESTDPMGYSSPRNRAGRTQDEDPGASQGRAVICPGSRHTGDKHIL